MANEDPKSFEENTLAFGSQEEGTRPPYMVVVDGPRRGAKYPLQEGVNVLGRLDDCQVVLDDQSVSRKHAELSLVEKGWTLKDLQSKNGTHVNGTLIGEPVVIGHQDQIRVGIYTLKFVAEKLAPEEELALAAEQATELAPMEAPGGGMDADTAQLALGQEPASKPTRADLKNKSREITSPHSALEEEDAPTTPYIVQKNWLPKARLWILGGVLFVLTLMGGLYAYWQYVLGPQEEAEQKAVAEAQAKKREERKIQSVPYGPPTPQKPATVPVFLDCVANPFPATIVFQSKSIGQTPLKINVELEPDKSYEIEAQFQMPEIGETYSDKQSFQMTMDSSVVPLLFKAPVGTIKVVSLPRDVSMYLEAYFDYNRFQGKPIKLTSLILNKPIYVPLGRYILELRQAKSTADLSKLVEDIIYRREFVLQTENPSQIVDVTPDSLQQFPAEITSIPSGADVYIDQILVGKTPYAGNLPVGKHTATLRKEGYFETVQEMATEINAPYKAEIALKSSLAGEKINLAKDRLRQALYQEAIQYLSEVFTLNPTDYETAEARYLLGKIHISLKDFSKAQGYFAQAKTHPDFLYWSKLGLAEVSAEQGDVTSALLPLVEVFLNAREDELLKEAHAFFRKMSPLRSVVYIQSDPPGAEVFVNENKLAQVTPVLLHEIGLGSYRIQLVKPGFQPLNLTLNLSVNEFNPVLAKLKTLQ